MADTTTARYGLTKPEVGASNNTWGDKINANLDAIDAAIYAAKTKADGIDAYTAADVLAKLLTVDVDNSGLNASTLQGANLTDVRDASQLTGTLADGRFPARMAADIPSLLSNVNTAILAGWYMSDTTASNSPMAGQYFFIQVLRKGNAITQIARQALVSSPGVEYERYSTNAGSTFSGWFRRRVTESQLDGRYAQLSFNNTFSKGQYIQAEAASGTTRIMFGLNTNTALPRAQLGLSGDDDKPVMYVYSPAGSYVTGYKFSHTGVVGGDIITNNSSPLNRFAWAGDRVGTDFGPTWAEPYAGGVVTGAINQFSAASPTGLRFRYLQERATDGNWYTCGYV